MSSEFQNLVKSQSIDSITAQQLLAAGGPIFLDILTSPDIRAINTLIESYARIHSPSFGQPIPGSGLSSSKVGSGTIITPTLNEVYRVMGVNYANAGGVPITLDLGLGGVILQKNAIIGPGETLIATLPATIFCDIESHLYVTVTSGAEADMTTAVATMLVGQ